MRIVCLGDSLTWGLYGGSYVDALARLLPEHTLLNAGVGGNTVVNLLRRWERDVLPLQPDGVFVMVGGNDAISYHNPKVRPYYAKVQKIDGGYIDPETFESAYRELLTELQIAHLVTWVGLEPVEYSTDVVAALRAYNQRAAAAARALNIPVLDLLELLMPPQGAAEREPITMDFILTIGQREKIGWNDYESVRQRDGFTYTFDGVHVTPAGAQRMAGLIAAFIRHHS
ncbi:MAG: GDSL-type esterase/lipase family protein [bacterium]|nr:GDSL-type esterase/lipase family protein [bacterium]